MRTADLQPHRGLGRLPVGAWVWLVQVGGRFHSVDCDSHAKHAASLAVKKREVRAYKRSDGKVVMTVKKRNKYRGDGLGDVEQTRAKNQLAHSL